MTHDLKLQAHKDKRQQRLEKSKARLIAELPGDEEFCTLACANRRRVTDLRQRAAALLGEEYWKPYQGALSYTITLVAEEIKAAARAAEKRK